MDNRYVESVIMDEIVDEKNNYMTTDEVAIALVKLYAEHVWVNGGKHNEDYAEAVAISIRMLTD